MELTPEEAHAENDRALARIEQYGLDKAARMYAKETSLTWAECVLALEGIAYRAGKPAGLPVIPYNNQ